MRSHPGSCLMFILIMGIITFFMLNLVLDRSFARLYHAPKHTHAHSSGSWCDNYFFSDVYHASSSFSSSTTTSFLQELPFLPLYHLAPLDCLVDFVPLVGWKKDLWLVLICFSSHCLNCFCLIVFLPLICWSLWSLWFSSACKFSFLDDAFLIPITSLSLLVVTLAFSSPS